MRHPSTPNLLVGRDDELAPVQRLVADLVDGRGRTLWVEGEPGIGKSALLTAGLAGSLPAGAEVFWAAADDVGTPFPLRALLDGIRIDQRSSDSARAEIANLLWGRDHTGFVTQADAVAAAAEHLVRLVEQACSAAPVVLVFDDLQWADSASLMVWARLAKLTRQIPLLVAAAARRLPRRDEVAQMRRLVADEDGVVLTLGPLGEEPVQEMVGRLLGAAPGPALVRWLARAGGNPLYVREITDALLRERQLVVGSNVADVADSVELTPPGSLAATIADRLRYLSDPTIEALRLAALLGADFSVDHLAKLTGRTVADLAAAIDEAVAGGVVVDAGKRLAFRHGLIRDSLYEGMPRALRSALHREAAEALANGGATVEQVASHLLAGPEAADAWVANWLSDAATRLAYRAPHEAVSILERFRATTPSGDKRDLMDAGLVTALFLLGRHGDVEHWARPVLVGTHNQGIAARMSWVLAQALLGQVRHEDALAVVEQTMRDRDLDPVWAARLRALYALILVNMGRHDEAQTIAREVEVLATAAHDRLAIGYALQVQCVTTLYRHDDESVPVEDAMLRIVDHALAVLGVEPEVNHLRLLLAGNRASLLGSLGRQAEAGRAFGEAAELAERSGAPPLRLATINLQAAEYSFLHGAWSDALAGIDATTDVLPIDAPHEWLWLHSLASLIAFHRDDRAAFSKHQQGAESVEVKGDNLRYLADKYLAARALSAERDGDPADALRQLQFMFDPTSTLDFSNVPDRDSFVWLPDLVRLALDTGNENIARAATEACTAEASRTPAPLFQGLAAHCRGLLATDADQLMASADVFAAGQFPLYQAEALENAARQFGRDDRGTLARAAFLQATEIYTKLDAAWNLRRADTRLRPLGIRRGVGGPRRRPATGWDALSPAELSIARLVASGRSNPDIGADLFISRRTVETHVSHIMNKLGVRSRVEIAREASSHGQLPLRAG